MSSMSQRSSSSLSFSLRSSSVSPEAGESTQQNIGDAVTTVGAPGDNESGEMAQMIASGGKNEAEPPGKVAGKTISFGEGVGDGIEVRNLSSRRPSLLGRMISNIVDETVRPRLSR